MTIFHQTNTKQHIVIFSSCEILFHKGRSTCVKSLPAFILSALKYTIDSNNVA